MSEKYILDFELPLKEIEDKIRLLENTSENTGIDVQKQIDVLRQELISKKDKIYNNLSRWEIVQLARHPSRPHAKDYIEMMTNYWFELHGDRLYSDDSAILSGIAFIDDVKFIIIAQEKGKGTKDKLFRNFGMPRPEGYRKAGRIMRMAEKFKLPILTIIDTPGAYPGIGAEERGQGQAIAENLILMSQLKVPIISTIIGEGASGGALAIGLSDKILCLKNSWYSVISPEGCASILFRDSAKANEAADSMKVTSKDLFDIGIADLIIDEPNGSAHIDPQGSSKKLKEAILSEYQELIKLTDEQLVENRMAKYNSIGDWTD
ncbi:MAG: acetyl-CoA carboxylase carboxyl transferase subunit alpha [Candidatus Marinimicrobia bacterium]|nr:acetyl-CoA carboxylase carboxyl transferase subunit alpha [Candidatus Neomarinimicrobiota bacterium]|tara:strand:- start:1356 stop:2315 length:960 start_codon:yes stop_codon:yes gene_type:complete